jgi:hypothetical protein
MELLIAAMQTELSRLGNGIVLRLMLLLRYLSSRGSVRILVLLLLLTLLLILLPLDLVSTGGYAVVMLLRVECHDAFLSCMTANPSAQSSCAAQFQFPPMNTLVLSQRKTRGATLRAPGHRNQRNPSP